MRLWQGRRSWRSAMCTLREVDAEIPRTGRSKINPAVHPEVDDTSGPRFDTWHMSLSDYLLNGALVALVVLQIRGRRLSVRALALPLVVVAAVAASYLHGFPATGGDLALVAIGGAAGALLGTGCGLATRLFRRDDGTAIAKAGSFAAALWVVGVGARMTFALYATHGGAGAIGRFSAACGITSGQAWVDALVLMALAEVGVRVGVLGLRWWRLAGAGGSGPTKAASGRVIMDVGGHIS